MWKAKRKLEDEYYRPKGMHNTTYERLLNDVYEAERVCNHITLKYFGIPVF